jgi:hypothetical protein
MLSSILRSEHLENPDLPSGNISNSAQVDLESRILAHTGMRSDPFQSVPIANAASPSAIAAADPVVTQPTLSLNPPTKLSNDSCSI